MNCSMRRFLWPSGSIRKVSIYHWTLLYQAVPNNRMDSIFHELSHQQEHCSSLQPSTSGHFHNTPLSSIYT
jgi:hypothetical protein